MICEIVLQLSFVLAGIKIMTKFFGFRYFSQFETVHFAFNTVKNSKILSLNFVVLNHRFCDILDIFKSQPFLILFSFFVFSQISTDTVLTVRETSRNMPRHSRIEIAQLLCSLKHFNIKIIFYCLL